MHLASALFALLAADVLVSNIGSWMYGAPVRITPMMAAVIALSVVLTMLLWRTRRWAPAVGLVTATVEFFFVAEATYFLWPYILPSYGPPRALFGFVVLVLMVFLTASIALVLARELLSNERLERQ